MSDKQTFVLISDRVHLNALNAVRQAPAGHVVTISPPKRSLDQNAMFHALCEDVARSKMHWFGKPRDADEWKVLLISGHAVATKNPAEVVPGLEGELVAIRESSARMTVARASSLIDYTLAHCAKHGIELRETRRQGFLASEAA